MPFRPRGATDRVAKKFPAFAATSQHPGGARQCIKVSSKSYVCRR